MKMVLSKRKGERVSYPESPRLTALRSPRPTNNFSEFSALTKLSATGGGMPEQ